MTRGAITKDKARLLNLWVPEEMLPALDLGVRALDLDRSKFVRAAIREKLERAGIALARTN
jgi:metal-responsive CopG/Arc/MetJ family transcriptional regulator